MILTMWDYIQIPRVPLIMQIMTSSRKKIINRHAYHVILSNINETVCQYGNLKTQKLVIFLTELRIYQKE